MKKINRLLFLVACIAQLTGCASGPRYNALHATEPPMSPGSGRIYIYRTALVGAAVQPDVKIGDEVIGTAVPGGYFFIDRPAGSYEISTTTEVKRTLGLTLEPAQARYVRLNIGMGFFVGHIWPELIDDAKGQAGIQNCHFTGR